MSILVIATPLGPMTLEGGGISLTGLRFGALGPDCPDPLLLRAREQLEEYFAGSRRSFDLPLSPKGTEFQLSVWRALLDIPYGETRTYGQIAHAIGSPKAARAVGMANNKNPIAIIIPCHRVIGADGRLVGYAGGLGKKELLLALESK